jgi:hypothetical protein
MKVGGNWKGPAFLKYIEVILAHYFIGPRFVDKEAEEEFLKYKSSSFIRMSRVNLFVILSSTIIHAFLDIVSFCSSYHQFISGMHGH